MPSGPTYGEPAIDWRDITRTPTTVPARTRAPGPAPVRTVLIVLGSAVGGTGAAGYIAGLVSSTVPFQILGWGALGAGVLVLVVRLARAIGGRITGGGP
ncbi:hypothetical protein [Glycomyces artemisiae]|uniref:hypothetical protein n=1 Tax=Glycomyces artemisiae TaxID=1076443 RepID=UPI000D059522|nr:hypothetical protein [Glycomyces artemisiae]